MSDVDKIKELQRQKTLERADEKRKEVIRQDAYVVELKTHIEAVVKQLADGIPVSNLDMEELAEKISTKAELLELATKLTAISDIMQKVADKNIEIPNTVSIGNFTILLKGIREALKDSKVVIPDNKKELEAIRKEVESLSNSINKQVNQKITDWIPFRRVRVMGNKEYWDDADWGSSPGGGGGGASSGESGGSIDTSTLATSAKQDTLIGHVDGVEAKLDTANVSLSVLDDWDESDRAKVTLQKAATGTTTSVADTASNTTLLASNSARLGATIYNDSTVALYLKLGATATTSSFTIKMDAGDYYEVPAGYTGIIDGIWASDASGSARITELT